MKRLLTVLMAGLLIAALVVPAVAWEFSMTGEYEMRLRYLSRTGDTDLFGVAPLQDAAGVGLPLFTAVGFAGPRWYNQNLGPNGLNGFPVAGGNVGARITDNPAVGQATIVNRPISAVTGQYVDAGGGRIVRGGYSTYGCDALYHDSRLTLRPVIRVNPAIRVHGVYTVGGMRHKYFQNYIGAFGVGIGTPPLERYYMHQTSMNAYDTAALGSWEQFRATIQSPIGIWSIGVKDFPFGIGANLAYNTRAESFLTVLPYGPFRILHAIWLARSNTFESWFQSPDKDLKRDFFEGAALTYDCGAFNFGAIAIVNLYHGSPGANRAAVATDNDLQQFGAFAKYNNGRVFAAAEYFWLTSNTHRVGAGPTFREGYNFASEVGAVAGPAKVRLMYAQASGPVLNAGNPTKAYIPLAINYQFLSPYQFLMFETYAGGNDTYAEDHGQMSDAFVFAGRADYAVASNLNVWASYLWAHRLEQNGYFKGGKASDGSVASAALRQQFVLTNWGGASGEVGGPINPFVDDGYLGWEANVGVDWKLLEGLTMFVQYAYWQPGEFFDQAYQAVGMVGGVVPTFPVGDTTILLPIARVSGRDAIHAIIGSFLIDF